jgi:hypothetical protein
MDIYLATKKVAEAECRLRAMLHDYRESGYKLKAKVIKEYEEALAHLNELMKYEF